jgi:hypothetical protein
MTEIWWCQKTRSVLLLGGGRWSNKKTARVSDPRHRITQVDRPEFRDVRNKQWMTHDRWCAVVQYLPATSLVWRRTTFLHCYDVMEFRSEFWCSGNCSSTMRAFLGTALRVIWYFYHTADRHPTCRSCDISFVHFRIFFMKTPIRVWLKASETSISTQKNSFSTLCMILEGFAHIFVANCSVCLTDQCI